MQIFSIILLATVKLLLFFMVSAAPRVTISDGILEGTLLRSRNGRLINAFRGVPYARPPIGKLRFQPPQPSVPWRGVRAATDDGPMCLQKIDLSSNMTTAGSEDCLFLNVYTCNLPTKRNGFPRYAVMVWFHGGSWTIGNLSLYEPGYLLDHDIVLVTMNYRLGPLGFLSTGDRIIPGNNGLKDKVQALRWVQMNIAAFGGDPKRVTIIGESSGGMSVHYLMLSQLAEGLFHRAISQSGSTLSSAAFSTIQMAKENAHRLGRQLNCPVNSSDALLQCLQTRDSSEITAISGTWPFPHNLLIPFRPVAEPPHTGAFLTDGPSELLQCRRSKHVPWLTGVTSDEGSILANWVYGKNAEMSSVILNDQFSELIPVIFGFSRDCSNTSKIDISRQIRRYYFGDRRIDNSTRMNVVNMTSDALFNFPSVTAVKEHLRKRSSVYYYYFAYSGDVKNAHIRSNPEKDFGVGHAEDLLYLFPVNHILFPNGTMSSRDWQMVDAMTTLWTNFARFGKPVPSPTLQLPVKWEPVRTNSLETFVIRSPTKFDMTKDMFEDMLGLWSNFPCRAGLSRSSDPQNA